MFAMVKSVAPICTASPASTAFSLTTPLIGESTAARLSVSRDWVSCASAASRARTACE